jgi:hypothetical protein
MKLKRYISFVMLFVFGVLSLKVLFAGAIGHGNCDEFGHIHFHKAHKATQNINTLSKPSGQQDDVDDNCHEGKSVFTYATFPADIYNFALPKYDLIFELVFSLENNFKSPYLEPHRKPPKYS